MQKHLNKRVLSASKVIQLAFDHLHTYTTTISSTLELKRFRYCGQGVFHLVDLRCPRCENKITSAIRKTGVSRHNCGPI